MDDSTAAPPAPQAPPPAPAPPAEIAQILLAKQVLAEGARLLAQGTRVGLGLAVSLGQDAAELMLRALFKQWGLASTKKPADLGFHDLLRAVDEACRARAGESLPRMQKLGELNTARVNFKHYGLIPDPDDARRIFGYAGDFFDAACRDLFEIDPATVSMADLVADEDLRGHLKEAQALLAAGDIDGALEQCAWASRIMDQWFERVLPALPGGNWSAIGGDAAARYLEASFGALRDYAEHLRGVAVCAFYGVDPEDWRFFRAVVPKLFMGYDHKPHFTYRTVLPPDKMPAAVAVCVDFAIDMALVVHQRGGSSPRLRKAGL